MPSINYKPSKLCTTSEKQFEDEMLPHLGWFFGVQGLRLKPLVFLPHEEQ